MAPAKITATIALQLGSSMRFAAPVWALVLSATAQTLSSVVPAEIQTQLDVHDYPKAEQAIREKLAASPGWAAGHVLLAQIYNATGRYAAAERSGLAAVSVRESVDAFLALAVATMNLRKLNDSIGWLDKASKRQPANPEIYKVLGLNYALGGMLWESEQAFRQAAALSPGDVELHYLDGRALYELEKFQDSEKELQHAIELDAASVKAWTALGQVEDRLGDAERAEQNYRKALDLCSGASRDCAWPLLELGFLASRQTGEKQAERYFRRAVEARPDWAKPHFYLGKTLAALGQLDAARTALEAAAQIEPGQSQYEYQLAQVYRRMGDRAKSKQHLARYRELAARERKKKTPAELNVP
jgi:predicted Zn-dependent protease